MAAINDLVAQIKDEALRLQIEAELKRVMKRKKFGLVFEDHLPEDSNVYASQYSLYLPDKALLQRKLKEWREELSE